MLKQMALAPPWSYSSTRTTVRGVLVPAGTNVVGD
jgi:hypothetical protein